MATQISQFRNRVVVEVPGCPIPRIDLAIIDSIRKMCDDTYAYTKSMEFEAIAYSSVDPADNDAITLTLSTYITDVDPIAPLFFQIDGGEWTLSKLVLENDNSNLTSIEQQGVKFFSFPSLTSMKIFPFTDQSANFDIFLKLAVKPSRGLTSVEDIFYTDDYWFEGIWRRSAYELQIMPKRPWTNPEQAAFNKGKYNHFKGMVRIGDSLGGAAGSKAIEGGYF